MTIDPDRPGYLELARRVVALVGEIVTVAVVARSLYNDRRPATMERHRRQILASPSLSAAPSTAPDGTPVTQGASAARVAQATAVTCSRPGT